MSAFTVRAPGTARAPHRLVQRLSRASRTTPALAEKLSAAAAAKEAHLQATLQSQETLKLKQREARERREAAKSAAALKLQHKEELASERAKAALATKSFKAHDDLMKVKDARRRLTGAAEAKADQLSASLSKAEQNRQKALQERTSKAAAMNERHAAVVGRVRETASAETDQLACKIERELADAAEKRFHRVAWTVTKNVAHGLYAEQVVARHARYEASLKQYKDVSTRCELEMAARRREARLMEIREKATATVDRARLTVQYAKQRAAAELKATRRSLESKLRGADLRARLTRAGALDPSAGDRLSLCGNFVVCADGTWKDIPSDLPPLSRPGSAATSPCSSPGKPAAPLLTRRTSGVVSDGDEEAWEVVVSPA